MNIRHLIILIFSFLLFSCGGTDKKKIITTQDSETEFEKDTLAEIVLEDENSSEMDVVEEKITDENFYFVTTVDNLRMRQSPGLESETICSIPENKILIYQGVYTAEKFEIELRGQKHKQAWYQVNYDNKTGWVYGGAIKQISKQYYEENFDI